MAKETTVKETATAEKQTEPAEPKKVVQQESTYKVKELADNAAKLFSTRPECVTAALKAENRETFTVSEAKGIVEKFLKKEVK